MSEGSTSTVLLLNVDALINQSTNLIQFRQLLSNPNFYQYFIPIPIMKAYQKHEQKRHGYNNTFIVGINSMGTYIKVSIHFK